MSEILAPPRTFLISLSLISGAALAFEILLMRLFSIILWHHFAHMIISLALLGFGASGAYLSLRALYYQRRFPASYITHGALFCVTAPMSFAIAQLIPFNPLEVLWDGYQWLWLAAVYLTLMVPFFFAANCIGLSFIAHQRSIKTIYGFDLLGAGVGAVVVVVALWWLPPRLALVGLALVGWGGVVLGAISLKLSRVRAVVTLIASLLAIAITTNTGLKRLHMSEYKGLSQAMVTMGATRIAHRTSPLGQLTAVDNRRVPLRQVPGLSLTSSNPIPHQIALFNDGEPLGAVAAYNGDLDTLAYLDEVPAALAYHLLDPPRVLILGAGGGAPILQALYHNATRIDVIERDPALHALLHGELSAFSGGLYAQPQVHYHLHDPRGFLSASPRRFDLIQIAPLGGFSASSAGLYALASNYLYTVEGLKALIAHVRPGGILALSGWSTLPPKSALKLFATVSAALEDEAAASIVWIRAFKIHTLLVIKGGVSAARIAKLKDFSAARSFDLNYYPGMSPSLANRYNILPEPYYFQAAQKILSGERDDFIQRYKFHISPPSDDKPYFNRTFKWATLPELWGLRAHGGVALADLGYLVLALTAIQAVLLSCAIILAPLIMPRFMPRIMTRIWGTRADPGSGGGSGYGWVGAARILSYFLCLGLAFIFLELAFMQILVRYLSHPLYATTVVIAAFLIFAGLGSLHLHNKDRLFTRRDSWPVLAAIGISVVIPLALMPTLFELSAAWYLPARLAIAVALIAPLAFFLGKPFPMGLAVLARMDPNMVPWAWGVNGCGSVIGAVFAIIIAMEAGLTALVGIALTLYVIATCVFPAHLDRTTTQ